MAGRGFFGTINVNVQWTMSELYDLQAEISGAVQVTTCRGRGRIVSGPLQAALLVHSFIHSFIR